ncbi:MULTISPECIES: hypothetical protein [Curtobacterium]|uniref:hypothetical protein n=1 Tax=Curtobacterium flaccumfaciens TaxID=2035 RepID=UPI003EE4DA66
MTSINSKKAGIVGIVGVALALLVAPLSTASADGGSMATACIGAETDGGKFASQVGGCRAGTDEPSAEPTPEPITYKECFKSRTFGDQRQEWVEVGQNTSIFDDYWKPTYAYTPSLEFRVMDASCSTAIKDAEVGVVDDATGAKLTVAKPMASTYKATGIERGHHYTVTVKGKGRIISPPDSLRIRIDDTGYWGKVSRAFTGSSAIVVE